MASLFDDILPSLYDVIMASLFDVILPSVYGCHIIAVPTGTPCKDVILWRLYNNIYYVTLNDYEKDLFYCSAYTIPLCIM